MYLSVSKRTFLAWNPSNGCLLRLTTLKAHRLDVRGHFLGAEHSTEGPLELSLVANHRFEIPESNVGVPDQLLGAALKVWVL